jgi:hypothetical protein
MVGRITSQDRSLNRFGVPWERLYQLSRETAERYTAALVAALEAWDTFDRYARSRSNSPKKLGRLRDRATDLTRRALR